VEKLPLLALSLASSAVTLWAQHNAVGTLHCPFLFRMANADISYIRYIKKMVWPTSWLCVSISARPGVWQVVIAALALGCLTVLAIRHARTHPYLLTGWLWYWHAGAGNRVVQVGFNLWRTVTYVPLLGCSSSLPGAPMIWPHSGGFGPCSRLDGRSGAGGVHTGDPRPSGYWKTASFSFNARFGTRPIISF